jgi:hypothetical protein
MGFKYYYHNDLLVEAEFLVEFDTDRIELEKLKLEIQKAKEDGDQEKQKELGLQLGQLVQQMKRNKQGQSQDKATQRLQKLTQDPHEIDQYKALISKVDPTGKYHDGIITWLVNKSIHLPEDLMNTKEILDQYQQHKNEIKAPNPNNTKHPSEVSEPIKDYLKLSQKQKDNPYYDLPVVKKEGNVIVYKIEGDYHEKNCKRWMEGTDWCVRFPENYKDYGPPFYLIQDGDKKFLLHVNSVQFKNRSNNFNLEEFKKYVNIVKPFFDSLPNTHKLNQIEDEEMLDLMYRDGDSKNTPYWYYINNPKNAYAEAKEKGFQNLDPQIIDGIASDKYYADSYAQNKGYENLDTTIDIKILKYPRIAFRYAKRLNFQNIDPKIIYYISKDPFLALQYAQEKGFDKLDMKTEDDIITSDQVIIPYAKAKGFKNLPPEVMQFIVMKSQLSLQYAAEKNYDLDPNKEADIIKSISNSPSYSFSYAKEKIKKSLPVEPEIISSISAYPNIAINYAIAKRFKNIEPDIITSIASKFNTAFEYQRGKGNLDPVTDAPIIKALED